MNLKKRTLITTIAALGLTGVAGLTQNNASAANVNPQQSTATTQETSSPASVPTSQANSASSSTTTLSNFAQQHSGDSSASNLVSSTKQAKSNFLNNTYQDKEISGKAAVKQDKADYVTAFRDIFDDRPYPSLTKAGINYFNNHSIYYGKTLQSVGANIPGQHRELEEPSYYFIKNGYRFDISDKGSGLMDVDGIKVSTAEANADFNGENGLGPYASDDPYDPNYPNNPYDPNNPNYPDYPGTQPTSYDPDPSDNNQARLPKTGDSNFNSSILLGIMITMLGAMTTTFNEIEKRRE